MYIADTYFQVYEVYVYHVQQINEYIWILYILYIYHVYIYYYTLLYIAIYWYILLYIAIYCYIIWDYIILYYIIVYKYNILYHIIYIYILYTLFCSHIYLYICVCINCESVYSTFHGPHLTRQIGRSENCCATKHGACLGRSKFCERHLTLALGVDDLSQWEAEKVSQWAQIGAKRNSNLHPWLM